ncbi:hypothetical protein BGZ82_004203 [Podila clonocystis]|nr:hypothetical protein BGZ82_004203 [Podila clonocystis]
MPALRSAPGRAVLVNSASLTGVITVEDIVYKPSDDIAIKMRTTADPLLPMSSVPHDWSWSTF